MLAALKHVLTRYGRFSELYTDRASHFCYTAEAGQTPSTEHDGAVSRALKVPGIVGRIIEGRRVCEKFSRTATNCDMNGTRCGWGGVGWSRR